MADFADLYWTTPDGLKLHARDYQSGTSRGAAVVLLHGLTRNARDFEDLAPRLVARGRRVVAMDVRGRGLSDWSNSPETYNPAVYAADLAGWCAALGLERILVIGTSMGGLIAMSTAGLFPDLVAGAVLNDVGPVVEASGLARISGYAGGAAAPIGDWKAAAAYARRTNGLAFPAYGERDWERFARRIFRQTPEGLVLDYDPAIGRPLSDAAQPVPAPDLWPLFERLAEGRPLGLIRGETSDILGAGTAAEMARRAPHMRTAQVAGVGHAPMLDEPEALALIAAFLETAP